MPPKKIVFIVGPTAVGKTEISVALAKDLGGEIVSCDAMQVYKEVSIANNKPSESLLKAVPHHLIGIVSISDNFDVAIFNRLAGACIQEIHARGRIPVVTGGSGMYMEVLLDGIFAGAANDERYCRHLEDVARRKGVGILHERLKEIDPVSAGKIHPNDARRMIRALEVYTLKKRPLSQINQQRSGLWGRYDVRLLALNRDRKELYARIDQRVEEMFHMGLVKEMQALKEGPWSRTASGIIGVKEVMGYLGKRFNLSEAQEQMKLKTRHYAKRQMTWFRREKRLEWLQLSDQQNPQQVVEQMKAKLIQTH